MFFHSTAHRERGASSVEYGLIVMLIAALMVTAVVAFGGLTNGLFSDACDEYSGKAPASDTSCP
ncbi:MAG: Flp family type IVb pilin [Nocardioidaceae bacterium]|nr:Flp family type IVb pilin [Nocardioidaceae bacterium]